MSQTQGELLRVLATRVTELEKRLGEHMVRCEGREQMNHRECQDTNLKVNQLTERLEVVVETSSSYRSDRQFLRGGLWVVGGLTVAVPIVAPIVVKIVQVWVLK